MKIMISEVGQCAGDMVTININGDEFWIRESEDGLGLDISSFRRILKIKPLASNHIEINTEDL